MVDTDFEAVEKLSSNGYKRLACTLLYDAIEEARRIDSESPPVVVAAIMAIDFLGQSYTEIWFGLAGIDYDAALDALRYRDLVGRALFCIEQSPPIRKALLHKYNLLTGDILRRAGLVRGWPSSNPATMAMSNIRLAGLLDEFKEAHVGG